MPNYTVTHKEGDRSGEIVAACLFSEICRKGRELDSLLPSRLPLVKKKKKKSTHGNKLTRDVELQKRGRNLV